MAFAARLGPLVEDLVSTLIGSSCLTKGDELEPRRNAILRQLRSHSYLRTNQFDVQNRLDGLEERFRVNHRDGLADALRERLDILSRTPQSWHPELLFLFLELSDQPTFKSRQSDLRGAVDANDDSKPPLRWDLIAREDGWSQDEDIWKRVNYATSSDDEFEVDEFDRDDDSESLSGADDSHICAKDLTIHTDDPESLASIMALHEWRAPERLHDNSKQRKTAVTELQVIQEVLLMLLGLDTNLFNRDCMMNATYQMADLAWETHKSVVQSFGETGRRLSILREAARQPESLPIIQVFLDCVTTRLRQLDARIFDLQGQLASPSDTRVVSLNATKAHLSGSLEPLYALSDVLLELQRNTQNASFRYLELLFAATSEAQLSGKDATFEVLAQIFMECFQTYLRPIRLWMDEGRLITTDQVFFLEEASRNVPLGGIWSDRFVLRTTADGDIHTPKFLRPAVNDIINAGKNVVVLRSLGKLESTQSGTQEPELSCHTVCPREGTYAPFEELFEGAFNRWIQSKYRMTSTILQRVLFAECDLNNAFSALQYLYFMADGSAASIFCEALFENLDTLDRKRCDRFALTAAGYEAFHGLVDVNKLTMSVKEGPDRYELSREGGSMSVLTAVKISFRLSWPAQMIISAKSLEQYQSVFTFLLQFRRGFHALHRHKLSEVDWRGAHPDAQALYYWLRNSLSWFCATVQTYLSTLVLAPNSAWLQQELSEAQGVDEMIAIHDTFTKRVIDEACLGTRLDPIRTCMLDVLGLAMRTESLYDVEEKGNDDPTKIQASSSRARPTKSRHGALNVVTLQTMQGEVKKHLRFICGGLRSVARATNEKNSSKWNMLAEMLQPGVIDESR